MPTYQDLKTQVAPVLRRITAQDRPRISVRVDTSSIAVGALQTLAALREVASSRGLGVDVDQVGGDGLSFANPVVGVQKPPSTGSGQSDGSDVLYQHVTAADAAEFLDAVLAPGASGDNRWLLGAVSGAEGLQRLDAYPWWSVQKRRLMAEMGLTDPDQIDDFIALGAYSGLDRSLAMTGEEVIAEVTGSKLGGRSGGFFPTGRKWDFLRTSRTSPKNMVCNADEGDPGAWVNRMTLENDPHALIEGMVISGWAAGAPRGYIYIREEYPLAFERMQRAIDQAYERGLLGEHILGSEFSFELKIIRGAGSYLCGEETGLISSIEDGRGMPKTKPPFPAESGVAGEGSNVNNVGTYHVAAYVMRNGLEGYFDLGTERNPGTMLFSVSGNVQRVGCFELPFNATVRDAFEVCGGGAPEGRRLQALQPGGPLLGIMPAATCLDITLEPEAFREKGAIGLGGGGLVFLDDSACVLDLCAQYEWFIEDESCGRCTTCHGGSQRATEIIRRIQRGGGRESDLGKLRLLADTLRYSNCFHGQFALATLINALDWFTDDIKEHIFERRCRAHVCKGLIRYEADREAATRPENAAARARAEDHCINAVTGLTQGACLDCLVCHEILPGVVRVVDAFDTGLGPAPELISVQPADR